MAYESSTMMTISDPAKVADDVNDIVRPALQAMGALDVLAGEAMTGPVGTFVLSTRWESLEHWSAAQAEMAAGMAAGGPMADLASRYTPFQRILFQDVSSTAGTAQGAFVLATRYSATSTPEHLDHAAEMTVAGGANGGRVMAVLAGAEMTGHLVGVMYVDSPNAMEGIMAAARADAVYQADLAASGAQLQSRTVYRVI